MVEQVKEDAVKIFFRGSGSIFALLQPVRHIGRGPLLLVFCASVSLLPAGTRVPLRHRDLHAPPEDAPEEERVQRRGHGAAARVGGRRR